MTAPRLVDERPHLTVIEGWKQEERQVDVLAFFTEVEQDAAEIHYREAGMDVPNARVIFLAGRMAHRAGRARDEYLALTEPDGAA